MVARDALGNLAPTVWTAEDQFGSDRRASAGTTLTLECVDRDSQGFRTPYRHVRIHMKGKTGGVEFLLNGPEAAAFAQDVMTYSREAQRVTDQRSYSRLAPVPEKEPEGAQPTPAVPVPNAEPGPVRKRARR